MLLMWRWCLCLRGWEAKKAFGRFEAWQTARLHVNKRLLEHLEGLTPGVSTPRKSYWCRLGVFACGVGGATKAFGAFGGWLWCLCLRGWGCQKGVWSVWRLEGLRPGKRHAGLGVFACGVVGAKFHTLCLRNAFRAFERFEAWQTAGLNAKKSYWCGLGVFACGVGGPKNAFGAFGDGFGVFACGVVGAKKAFGAFGGFEAWQTARLNANEKLLMWPWCLCLRGWRS